MTGEIISIHVGCCGNKLGYSFWEMINKEHSINQSILYNNKYDFDYQLKNIDVYYNETLFIKYIPRAIFVDLNTKSMESLQSTSYFDSTNMIFAESSINNNCAAGFYTEGRNLIESITENVRKEAEACVLLYDFHLFHSL